MEKPQTAGHCFSASCAGHFGVRKGIVKTVPKTAVDCPDCGSILVWKRVGAFRNPGLKAEKRERKP